MAAQARPTARHGNADFSCIRAEFGLPADYPTAALVEAEQAVSGPIDYYAVKVHSRIERHTVNVPAGYTVTKCTHARHAAIGIEIAKLR